MEFLHSLRRRHYSLPSFEPAPLEFDPQAVDQQHELLLDAAVDGAGVVVQLGNSGRQGPPPVDAAEELRMALAELRRSIR